MANYENIIPFIKKVEGGLSDAVTDYEHLYPSPYTYKGKTGWHTNKGVTWRTFKGLASQLGYEVNANNFLTMPDEVWNKIFKNGFWDSQLADKINSQGVANQLVDMAWGAGPGTATKLMQQVLNKNFNKNLDALGVMGPLTLEAINSVPPKELFTKFTKAKLDWYTSLPGQSANYDGWTKRILSIVDDAATTTANAIKNNPIKSGLGLLALVAAIFALSKN